MCGDVTMAGDVLKTVQQIIKQQGQMSIEDAGFYISKLRVGSNNDMCSYGCSCCNPQQRVTFSEKVDQ